MAEASFDAAAYSSDLARAVQYKTAIPPLSSEHPEATAEEAYLVQVEVLSGMLRRNDSLIGTKVSYHGGQPVFGLFTRSALMGAFEVVDLSRLIEPAAQPVFVMRLLKEVAGDRVTPDQMREAIGTVVAGIEVIDSRTGTIEPASAIDAIADNDGIAKILVGEHGVKMGHDDGTLRSLDVSFTVDGVETGEAPRPLPDPLQAATALANHICGQGGVLEGK